MKLLKFLRENILFAASLFLIFFIPLYPKLPIFGVSHTWVYVRAEDFIVASILTFWIFLVLLRKVKLKTPLTKPILLFWVVGAISTFHGVLLIFPTLANVFPNVAFLSLFRRIEYLSVFFIAYTAIKEKRQINYVIVTLTITLFSIILYGLGQRFLGFPAFLTGNEEFAKGTALTISSFGRITSTFAGHYDLAAYLVLVIPIFTSLAFGFRNIILKILFLLLSALGFGLLFMTVSRVSFFVLIISLFGLLIFQKRKIVILFLLGITVIFLILSPSLLKRFNSTVSQIDVIVDSVTGVAIGQVKEVPREYFKDKLVIRNQATLEEAKTASSSAILPYLAIPPKAQLLIQPNAPTGENLPIGTGYVNLPLSPIVKRVPSYFTERIIEKDGVKIDEVRAVESTFLIKKAKAYDLSFTTRFQGEWPRTIESFRRNIFLGSGYGSVSLAVDNDYLRILGESGLFGLISFASIFLIAGIYIRKAYPKIDSPIVKSFVLGFIAGTFGLILNGVLIDVFEASKIAFTYWLLMGITLGILHQYNSEEINIVEEIKKVIISPFAVIICLLLLTVVLLLPMTSNYFVGDDFTWLRWAATSNNWLNFFTNADGFFYRPGAKLYFSIMYNFFWLNQTIYHIVSIILQCSVVFLLFILLRKIFKDYILTIITVFLFIILSSYHEAVFWISSTGFLFTTVFTLLSILFFIFWKEKKKNIYLVFSLISIILSPMFHELGVVTPLLVILYDLVFREKNKILSRAHVIVFSPLLIYLALRLLAGSHWFNGDYSYNILKLPFNFIGNAIGYFLLDLLGPQSLSFYELLRNTLKSNIIVALIVTATVSFIIFYSGRLVLKKLDSFSRKIVIFGFLFFIISLLPFLGLGNIASRYSYLASIGFIIPFALLIKWMLSYILNITDRYTAWIIIALISLFFMSNQLFQLQNLHQDWGVAGEKSKRFLISFENIYKDYWQGRHIDFYFLNTPIKNGEAWVFPVGLEDAVWFTFQNQNISVHNISAADNAFFESIDRKNSDVLKFDDYGGVQEVPQNSK